MANANGYKTRILLVEDMLTDSELAQREISKLIPCDFLRVDTHNEYLKALSEFKPDLIISDYQMPTFDGISALRIALESIPGTPVIILTAATNEDTAVECMKAGAKDYVIKEHIKRLGPAVLSALETRKNEAEKIEIEQQLIQSQKLESIGRLAGGVAHDFNNMLSVIIGYSEILKGKLPFNSPYMKEILEIEKAALHSRDITKQLLAFSRKEVISPKPLNLNDTMLYIKESLSRLIGEDIEITFKLADDLWTVIIDPTQAEQILVNLVVNARDAITGQGSIIIQTENYLIDETCCRDFPECGPGEYVKISVSDNGCGMDNETLSHIFEPFYTTKETGSGTGLGLATVYGNVKQNSGHIFVNSETGSGSTFDIFFPRSITGDELPPIDIEVQIQHQNGTILLVEDEEILREMITEMLEHIGYNVITASGPGEALSICRNHETGIDLLMTDIVMPEMNGTELRKKIEEIIPGIKILFISGYAADMIEKKGLNIGNADILQKPFQIKDLTEKIRSISGRKKDITPLDN